MSAASQPAAVPGDGAAAPAAPSSHPSTSQQPAYLKVLSPAQYSAVTAPPDEPLQILAGPGSGKTRVLVARVAWLILEQNFNPRDLVVVTFTNKAANEMRHRLNALIGQQRTSNLVLGTFHATCARYLRQYAKEVGLENNFSITDADQAKAAIKAILKDEKVKGQIDALKLHGVKPDNFVGEISRAKAKDMDVKAYAAWVADLEAGRASTSGSTTRGKPERSPLRRAVSLVYKMYTAYLRNNNALDFDDLLVFGAKLFRENARVTANIRHVLVDEFQDTNTIQYSLMATLSGRGGSRGAVSIVGDPDQSIYSWRSAEVANLKKMADEFTVWTRDNIVRRVFLEENYRSTGHILQTAKAIIDCDSNRIERGLYTSHALGPPPVCKQFANSQMEALFVATEIKRMIAASGNMLQFDDFAILLRFNALSREVEQQLQAENIPSRMLGGARFFERKEVKDILAYLTLAENPTFTPAMERVINVPKRGIGEKSVKDIMSLGEAEGSRAMMIVERVAFSQTKKPMGFGPAMKASLRSFASVIKELRKMAIEHQPVASIIEKAIKMTEYEAYLRKEPDFDQRWENVQELINFATIVTGAVQGLSQEAMLNSSPEVVTASSLEAKTAKSAEVVDITSSEEPETTSRESPVQITDSRSPESESSNGRKQKGRKSRSVSVAEVEVDSGPSLFAPVEETEVKSPLRIFLEAATLSTDMEQDDEDGKKPKVTIATTHAAKGLEFPVVFVLAVEEGTYPFYRAADDSDKIDEEARLLYVGVTRAQACVYLTHCDARLVHGQTMDKVLSRFVSPAADPDVVSGGMWGKKVQVGYDGQAAAPETRERVPYIKTRPEVKSEERKTMASVLGRPLPSDERAETLLSAFENSDVGVRARRADQEVAGSSLPSYTFYNPNLMFSRTAPVAGGFGSAFGSQGVRSHIHTQTRFGNATTAGSSANSSYGSQTSGPSYDADGWAYDTRAGLTSAVNARTQNGSKPPLKQSPKLSSSTFMDPYRASKGGVAHNGVIGSASALALQQRPTADAAHFKAKNDSSISSILALLPDDKGAVPNTGSSPRMSNSTNGNAGVSPKTRPGSIPLAGNGTSKRRLGTGRAQAPTPANKHLRREGE